VVGYKWQGIVSLLLDLSYFWQRCTLPVRCYLRACFVSFSVRIFEHDFVGDKEEIRRHTLCLARISDAASGKMCRKDVRKKVRNGLLSQCERNRIMVEGQVFLKKRELDSLACNPFRMIGKEWYLLTAGTLEDYNTMTASWGAMGEMWGVPSFHCVVRTNRYTLKYLDANDLFTVSFFDIGYKPALSFCGSNSGRDCDKAKETGLQPMEVGGSVTFAQARRVLVCPEM